MYYTYRIYYHIVSHIYYINLIYHHIYHIFISVLTLIVNSYMITDVYGNRPSSDVYAAFKAHKAPYSFQLDITSGNEVQ